MKTPKPVQIELVGYPCGCCRRVDINARGWNYCVVHRQHYHSNVISINTTRTAIEQSAPIQQVPLAPLVWQGGTASASAPAPTMITPVSHASSAEAWDRFARSEREAI